MALASHLPPSSEWVKPSIRAVRVSPILETGRGVRAVLLQAKCVTRWGQT